MGKKKKKEAHHHKSKKQKGGGRKKKRGKMPPLHGLEDLHSLWKNISLYNVISNKKRYPLKMRTAIIQYMKASHMKAFNDAIKALLHKKLPFQEKHIKLLYPHRHKYRRFLELNGNLNAQKNLLAKDQRGGFAFLLPMLTGLLTSVAAEGISAGISALKHKHHKK